LSKTLAVVAILLNRDGSAGVDICTRLASSEIDIGPPLQTKEFPQPSEMNINKTVDTPVRIRYRAALHLLAADDRTEAKGTNEKGAVKDGSN
jgi:hypothetical protein